MSYNWKCCSFYPNNFDASALRSGYDDLKAFFNGKTVISPPRHMRHIVFSKNIFALFS